MKWMFSIWLLLAGIWLPGHTRAQEATGFPAAPDLAAWCIVPFDAAKRGPEARAAMLEKLGISKFASDV